MASISADKLKESVKEILDGADLSSLSAKKVRRQLEEKFDADLTHRKKEIDTMLMELIEKAENGDKNENGSADESGDEEEVPKKKAKKSKSSSDDDDEDDDEDMARRLQEEESGRRTRAPAKKKRAPKEKKEPSKRAGQSLYSKPCQLSPALAEVMGSDRMARKDVVKTMWTIVKDRNLQDPKQKQFMLCDEQLQKIFGRKRVKTFGMMKYLKNHMTQAD